MKWHAFSYFKKLHGVDKWRSEEEKEYYKKLIAEMSPEDYREGLAEFDAAYAYGKHR